MFMHNLVRIKYVQEGYLPDLPYWQISDKEMCEAFIKQGGFFDVTYPCPSDSVISDYLRLKECVEENVDSFLNKGLEFEPWMFSYMLGTTTSSSSDAVEIEYLNQILGVEIPVMTEFTKDTAEAILEVSKAWINKMDYRYENRIPTVFGEPCIYKSLRLRDVDVIGG